VTSSFNAGVDPGFAKGETMATYNGGLGAEIPPWFWEKPPKVGSSFVRVQFFCPFSYKRWSKVKVLSDSLSS